MYVRASVWEERPPAALSDSPLPPTRAFLMGLLSDPHVELPVRAEQRDDTEESGPGKNELDPAIVEMVAPTLPAPPGEPSPIAAGPGGESRFVSPFVSSLGMPLLLRQKP